MANDVDDDQYKDFYYQHHGGAVSYGHQGRQGSQQYYMAIDQVRIKIRLNVSKAVKVSIVMADLLANLS